MANLCNVQDAANDTIFRHNDIKTYFYLFTYTSLHILCILAEE